MQQHDDVVSGWLNGDEQSDGLHNPAGPLYLHNADNLISRDNLPMLTGVTTSSCIQRGCACC